VRKPLERPAPRFGSIHADEALLLRELSRRFGWARRQQADALKAGLRSVVIGRQKFVIGRWVLDFLQAQADRQAGDQGEGGEADE
jgi:hypothetical protein